MLKNQKPGKFFFYPFLVAESNKLSATRIKEFMGKTQAG